MSANEKLSLVEFKTVAKSFSQDDVNSMKDAIIAAVDNRITFEKENAKDATEIVKKLNSYKKDATKDAFIRFSLAANLNAEYVNKHQRKNKRTYIYAMTVAMNSIVDATMREDELNKNVKHILATLKLFTENSATMTHADVLTAIHKDTAVKDAEKKKLFKNRRTDVALTASTASAQASLTMIALASLNVVKRVSSSDDDDKNVRYIVQDNITTRALFDLV